MVPTKVGHASRNRDHLLQTALADERQEGKNGPHSPEVVDVEALPRLLANRARILLANGTKKKGLAAYAKRKKNARRYLKERERTSPSAKCIPKTLS